MAPPQNIFSFFAGGTTIFTGGDLSPHFSPLLRTLNVGLNVAKKQFLQHFFACVPKEKLFKSGAPRRTPQNMVGPSTLYPPAPSHQPCSCTFSHTSSHISPSSPHTATHFPTPIPTSPSPSQSVAKLPCDEVSVAKLPCGKVTMWQSYWQLLKILLLF